MIVQPMKQKKTHSTVVEDKKPPPPDPNFQPYPQVNDPKLQDILFEKRGLIQINYS